MLVGLISDTHGRLRPEVFTYFQGVDRILHAGDIGPADLLAELEALAPVLAVHGNTDGFDVREVAPECIKMELAGRNVVVTHGHTIGSPKPQSLVNAFPDADLIVYGHTHRPAIELIGRTLVVNPGSAGAPRFGIRPTIALLELKLGPHPLRPGHVRLIEL